MKNKQLLFLKKHSLALVYSIIFLLNIAAIIFLHSFLNEYIVNTIYANEESVMFQAGLSTESINLKKFNQVIEKIEDKTNNGSVEFTNNLFQ